MPKKGRNLAKNRVPKSTTPKKSMAYKLGRSVGKAIGIKNTKKKGSMKVRTSGKKVKF